MNDKLKPYILNLSVTDETGASVFVLKLSVFKGDMVPDGSSLPTIEQVGKFVSGL